MLWRIATGGRLGRGMGPTIVHHRITFEWNYRRITAVTIAAQTTWTEMEMGDRWRLILLLLFWCLPVLWMGEMAYLITIKLYRNNKRKKIIWTPWRKMFSAWFSQINDCRLCYIVDCANNPCLIGHLINRCDIFMRRWPLRGIIMNWHGWLKFSGCFFFCSTENACTRKR